MSWGRIVADGKGPKQRLAAILAADVAGYSRLMQADERATIATLNEYRGLFRAEIETHDGRVVDMAGDSVLAVFDSAIGAVSAALAIQAALAKRNESLPDDRRMAFRIGINLGDIFEQADGTVYGDGVNVAARLEAMASPGSITVSGSVFDSVRSKVGVSFDFLGEQEVKNIADPVRAYRVADGKTAAATIPRRPNRRTLVFGAATALAAALLMGGLLWISRVGQPDQHVTADGQPTEDPVLAMPTGPTIAVLPLDNLSGDPEQDYFGDGLTEDLITRLSKFSELFVIARNSTFQYKGQAVDVREVGRDLGADYVVEGSVRRTGDSIRVTVQLLNAEDGTHLWAETFDRDLTTANIFGTQDEIANRISATIADERGPIWKPGTAAIREKVPESLTAYECILRIIEYYEVRTPNQHSESRDCAERAVKIDPNYSRIWTALSFLALDEFRFGYNQRPEPLERAFDAAQRAVALDSNSAEARLALAFVHFHRHDLELFRSEGERAIALNPNNATILADVGTYLVWTGSLERGSAMVKKAAALNPGHGSWYYLSLSYTEYQVKNYEKAMRYALKIGLPDFHWSQIHLAAAYGQLGRDAEAGSTVEKLLNLYPDFAEKAWEEFRKFNNPDAFIRHSVEGLRKAGLNIPPEPPE